MALIRALISAVIVVPLAFVLTIAGFWIVGTLGIGPTYEESPAGFWIVSLAVLAIAAGISAGAVQTINRIIFGQKSPSNGATGKEHPE
jgi:hypothetical protein